MINCQHPQGCPRPIKARGFCIAHYLRCRRSGTPGAAEIGTLTTDDLIVELGVLDGPPGEIAGQVGLSPAAIARRLYRAGRGDLAAPFERARKQLRRAA